MKKDYEYGYGGLTRIEKFGKKHMKSIKQDYGQLYPKPFNKRNAFQRQKRGKR